MLMILVEMLMWTLAAALVPISGLAAVAVHEHLIERDAVPHRELESIVSGTVVSAVALVIYLGALAYRIVEVLL